MGGLRVGEVCRLLKFHRKDEFKWDALTVPKQGKNNKPAGRIIRIIKTRIEPSPDQTNHWRFEVWEITPHDPPFRDEEPRKWSNENYFSIEDAIAAARKVWGNHYKERFVR